MHGESRRLRALDAGRGAAMLLVFLSHFADVWFGPMGRPAGLFIAFIASPLFILTSGLLFGARHALSPSSFGRIRSRAFARGVFLLVIAHPVILLAQIPRMSPGESLLRFLFITDVIGFALLFVPALVATTSGAVRAALGLALLAIGVASTLSLDPATDGARVLAGALVGTLSGKPALVYSFPLLPWLGAFLLGTALGGRAARGGGMRIGPRLARIGAACAASGGAARLAAHFGSSPAHHKLWWLSSTTAKLPPSPSYFLFNSGLALLCIAAIEEGLHRKIAARATDVLELLGRNSLFAFVLQFYVYYAGLTLAGHVAVPWPLLFAVTVVAQLLVVRAWDRTGWNSIFSFRLPPPKVSSPALR